MMLEIFSFFSALDMLYIYLSSSALSIVLILVLERMRNDRLVFLTEGWLIIIGKRNNRGGGLRASSSFLVSGFSHCKIASDDYTLKCTDSMLS